MTDVELRADEAQIVADIPVEWNAAWRLARRIHQTAFVPKSLQGDPAAVMACILTGRELGLGPMQSLQMINVIDGRPAISAQLMRALVYRAGHSISVVDATNDSVTLIGKRGDSDDAAQCVWTLADAERAGLVKNPAWHKYPRSMLLARATSELCRMLFADVIGGMYAPDEVAIEGHGWEPRDPSELTDPVSGLVLPNDQVPELM